MQKKLIARTAKLLTETKKGRRKGVAITYEHIPKDFEERNHGSLYAVIHVNAPADEAQEIVELIVEAFHGEYYQDLNREPLLSFEAALSKINEELADVTHQGNISWLNNLNAILAVLTGTNLHITKAGKTEAYLYRGEKQSHISDELAGDVVNPLRTFINIASGEMCEGDKIAIATPGTFFHLSKNELQKYVQGFQPKIAINHIADLLEGTTSEMNPNAVLIMEAITPEAASNETIEDEPDEVWISEPAKPLQTAMVGVSPYLKKIYHFFRLSFLGIIAFTAEVILPQVAKLIPAVKTLADRAGKKVAKSTEKVLAETEESLRVAQDDTLEDLALKETSEVIGQQVDTKKHGPNEIFIKEESEKPKWLKLEKVNFSLFSNISARAKRQSRKLMANRKPLAIVIVALAVVLLGGIFFTYQSNKNTKNIKVAESSINEAQSRYDAGKSALASGDNQKAAGILREAEQLALALVKDKKYGERANALLVSIRTALDQAEGVTRITPIQFADTSSITGTNTFGPFLVGNFIYIINRDKGSIAEVSLTSGEVSNVLDNPEIGKIVAATAVTKRSILVLATDNGDVYEFDTKESTVKKQDMSGEVEKMIALTSFSTNIYSIDANGTIYKRLKTSTGYGRRVEYITDGSKATGGVSLATDSNLYALKSDGNVVKYLVGKAQNFTLTLPFKVEKANYLYADETLSNIYFVDTAKARIISFSNQAKFGKQYVSDKLAGIGGLTVSGNMLYASACGKVYNLAR